MTMLMNDVCRPAANQPQQPLPTAFVFPSPAASKSAPDGSYEQEGNNFLGLRQSIWSDSQISDQGATAKPARSATVRSKIPKGPPRPPTHKRPFSFSTVDDTHKSSSELEDGVLRIVIDRSATSHSKTTEDFVLPTLEIPIPHYRLGKPHFSVQGTPILRSSAYTRTSEGKSENSKSISPEKNDLPLPEQLEAKSRRLSKSHTSDTCLKPNGTTKDAPRGSAGAVDSPTKYSHTEPMNPEVFDRLASVKDDASVVRYSPQTGAITAATPIRIVAQISSESFMDYELVSDFFLTFRAYLSTEDLLGLLLARLRWAINRLEDDGRIIRIRTFAALRHWILNYFVDDFVINRKLRVQFCDHINEMYHEVGQRTGRGVSDMKILLDLKRCWNGRCSLYWDFTNPLVDKQHEADIVPGGVLGSRDPSLTQLDIVLDQESDPTSDNYQNQASIAKTWFESPPLANDPGPRNQKDPAVPARAPVSPTSEQSLQPVSCSIPARAFRKSPPPESNARGPYPVSVPLIKHNSPSSLPICIGDSQRRLSNAHKRSCSTSDSIRDRGSSNSLSRPVFLVSPHAGSLIRGNVYPPAAPFVDVIAPESPPSQRSRLNGSPPGMPAAFDAGAKPVSTANPGMRTLMGSIRRALSSKQTGSNSASLNEEASWYASSLRGKTSGLPLNMARSIDTLRDQKPTPTPRHHLRIDLLCAAVSQSYQMAQAKACQDSTVNQGLGVCISDIHEDSGSQHSLGSRDFSVEADDMQCIQLQDLLNNTPSIVDDAAGPALSNGMMAQKRDTQGEVTVANLDFTTAAVMSMPLLSTERSRHRGSPLGDHQRSSSVDTALARRSKEQGQLGGAEYAELTMDTGRSFRRAEHLHQNGKLTEAGSTLALSQTYRLKQTDALRRGPWPRLDAPLTSSSPEQLKSQCKSEEPAHTLRRRPGGNLRNIENVHDLAPGIGRQSTGSLNTRSESFGSMLVIGGNRPIVSKQTKPAAQVNQHPISLIRTHSSQHLRPSFEAAISGFSKIPDDDDGGLEATLLKLEGRYEKASQEITNRMSVGLARGQTAAAAASTPPMDCLQSSNGRPSHSNFSNLSVPPRSRSPQLRQPTSAPQVGKSSTKSTSIKSGRSKSATASSKESYSSIPLLERGNFDGSTRKPKALPKSNPTTTLSRPLVKKQGVSAEQETNSLHPSVELVEKTESMGRIPQGSTFPDPSPPTADDSFLLDEDDNLTDLSSELSIDVIDHSEVKPRVVSSPAAAPDTATPGHGLPTHPLAHPPSPAFSFHHAITSVPAFNSTIYQQDPLTPQPSPPQKNMHLSSQASLSQILPPKKSAAVASATVTTSAGHIPFVLACESEILAQQLTLVEKAALSEIEWSDLVDMKWDNKSPNVLNWVEYLAAKDNRGIDIVITRFNIVVKWVLSEIVMTQNIYERAQAITKYIHIAGHARQIHNYATMLQITIALTSIDCTRLKASWELVPELEQALLKEMETLIQPIRNFHELRVEMETANLQDGCIPFVGMYTILTSVPSLTNS